MKKNKDWLRIVVLGLPILILHAAGFAYATTLTQKTFTCPIHGRGYQDTALASTNTLGGQDSEFRTYALGMQPLNYLIHTCPNCGVPDVLSLFPQGESKSESSLSAQDKSQIENCVSSFCKANKVAPPSFSVSQKYALLADIFILRGKPTLKIAETYIFAAWAADDEQNNDRSKAYRKDAIDFMIKALENQEVESEKIPIITYLVGELNRRIGRFDQALEWFARVKTNDPGLERLRNQQKELADKKESQKIMIVAPG